MASLRLEYPSDIANRNILSSVALLFSRGVFMAKMIPSTIDPDTKSSAEKKLFSLLRDMPNTDDWYVLHSVGVARHPTQSQGEADFIIVIPGGGTFVLEAKGGRIDYENGTWYSTDKDDEQHIIKNPIVEANNAMHALREFVKDRNHDSLEKSLFGFGVVFPDSTVHNCFAIPDLDDLQIADIDDMYNLKAYLLKLAGFWRSRSHNKDMFVPRGQQASAIVNILRPNYDFKVSITSQIRNVEKQIITMTDNQRMVFEGLLDNERCLIRGSAGTGKTVLAMEAARLFASQGKRVGLFCYNRSLAEWLRENISEEESIVCDSLLDYMESEISSVKSRTIEQAREEDSKKYYSEILPSLYAEYLIDRGKEPFDVLIIDEAQDVFTKTYLEALDLMISGGIANGSWYFFMDADKQNLYFAHMGYEAITRALEGYHCAFTSYSLSSNCRNSQAIIEKIDAIFGTHTKYRKTDFRGPEVVIRSYKKSQEEAGIVDFILTDLKKENVLPDDIVILSVCKFENSVASVLTDFQISTDRRSRKGKIYFSTVYSFKGLESPIVVLVDFDNINYEQKMNLLYVGMTRARSALYMVMFDKARQVLEKKIMETSNNEHADSIR